MDLMWEITFLCRFLIKKFVWKKVVPLWQQFPPRLLTMRTTVGLRFLYEDLKDGNIYEQTDM